jgi:hypothetical protein
VKRALVVFGLIALVTTGFGAQQSQERYRVRLSTVPMDASMRANVAGTGAASAVLSGSRLTISGTFSDLRSRATVARVHRGIMTGVRGSALGDLTVSTAISGMLTGAVDLSPDQVEGLRKGQLYIQIHSEGAPEGNLWGWLLR